jgi:Ni/Co efflux regulator RcnB
MAGSLTLAVSLLANGPALAQSAAEMQRQLNQQTLDRNFDVKSEAELDSYIEAATKRGQVPQPYRGTNWRRGYTCADLRPYGWGEYRDCMYYYRYYGRYYPY